MGCLPRVAGIARGQLQDPDGNWQLILRIEFDGRETVWCPVGDFFGSGFGLHPYRGWYHTVAEDGTMTVRWVMPYQKSGNVSLLNLNDKPVDVRAA